MSDTDQRTRFIFDNTPVRGLHIRLGGTWQHIDSLKHYPEAVRRALGELTAAACLLAANLKHEGSLILQIQGRGAVKMLVAEASSHSCRATARWDEAAEIPADADLHRLVGEDGIFAITLQNDGGEPWQGIVPLEGGRIADMLAAYMRRSEQLETAIVLAASAEGLGGLLLQRLPGEASDKDGWNRLQTLAATATDTELATLDAHTLLYRLFHETPPRVFPSETVEFCCTCSPEKVGNMLLLLGEAEINGIIAEQGSIGIDCDFCGRRYVFDEQDTAELFGNSAPLPRTH